MKNFTIKQRQEIYEHLLTLDCPDLLAALIAERWNCEFYYGNIPIFNSIASGFIWDETPEGWTFWSYMLECIADLSAKNKDLSEVPAPLYYTEEVQPIAETLEVVLSVPEDLKPILNNSPKISISVDTSTFQKGLQEIQDEVYKEIQSSLWTKVKLFFGKLFYKI